RGCIYKKDRERAGVEKTMYNSIFTVVERGKAEDVIEAAQKAGSKGGTVINARGSGIHETQKLFHMDIEPEKEIVLILSEEGTTDAIVKSISECIQIEDPGKGVLFVLDVSKTFGLY
ncbi:MAG TPA: transcriptional regulator, partial [Lachnoclostridium phytofermentans]|nr:transcriptional regulator [Lachnoclostridium phytofermentans]